MRERIGRTLEQIGGVSPARDWRPDTSFRDAVLSALPGLRAFALSLCGDAVRSDDLVQETFIRAWTNGHHFKLGSNAQAWLCTILRNQFYTERRRRSREVEDVDGGFANRLSDLPAQEGTVALKAMGAAMAALPDLQREALLMVGAEGYTYVEAAERLGCRVGTVKSRVSRARRRLADPAQPRPRSASEHGA